ncbi:MAG: GerAB/ArcD/ProY family transporter [Bacillota bacterium]|nr:GerAB/ArcD/ProY family transporter [Bacillota bacterium]
MRRYFFYIVFINSISNIIIFLAKFLVPNHTKGALLAIIFSLPFGTVIIYFFSRALMMFPGKNFSEILEAALPYWLRVTIMIIFCPAWYISGILMLSGTIDITVTFVDPQTSLYLILVAYIGLVIFSINTKGTSILYALEIFIFFIVPALMFVFIKAITNQFFSWDACMETVTHSFALPSISLLAVTTYNFSGYTDMLAFNRDFNGRFDSKHLWLFPVVILIFQLFTLFVPIGYLGTEGAPDFNFPWLASADCMVIKTGIIERILFIYLLIYLVTSLVNVIVHWYVSFELFKELFLDQFKMKNVKAVTRRILCAFAAGPFIFTFFIIQEKKLVIANIWLSLRVLLEVFLVVLLNYIAYKSKRKGRI